MPTHFWTNQACIKLSDASVFLIGEAETEYYRFSCPHCERTCFQRSVTVDGVAREKKKKWYGNVQCDFFSFVGRARFVGAVSPAKFFGIENEPGT